MVSGEVSSPVGSFTKKEKNLLHKPEGSL